MTEIEKGKFVGITNITRSGPIEVYDLEVAQDHEFYANGFLVHNCLGNYHPHGDKACLHGDTLVPLLFESTKTIADLAEETIRFGTKNPKEVIAYCPYTETYVRATAHSWRLTKTVESVIRITLFSGEKIECTHDHEILTTLGWKEASSLKNDDVIVGGTLAYGQDPYLLTQTKDKIRVGEFSSPKDKTSICLGKGAIVRKEFVFHAAFHNTVKEISEIVLESPESVYDFTVDGYENMIVLSSDGLYSGNFCVVHNCYDAIVNAAVNQNISMVHGEGNFGTMTEGPAAMRYCFSEDAKVLMRDAKTDKFITKTFGELAVEHKIYKVDGAEVATEISVASINGFENTSHIVCAGIHDTVRVTTKTGRTVKCTPNEPFYVYNTQEHSFSWVTADKLEPTNLVYVADIKNHQLMYNMEPVLSVTPAGLAYVYDLSVPTTHAFTANGFVVHNTNLKLSKYSDLVFFDKFYMPTVDYVPNYDGSKKEPLVLPALLPNAVLNGNFGIAPGVNTRSPMFSLETVSKVIQKMLSGDGTCTAEMCMGLEFTTSSGGVAKMTKVNKPEFLNFFQTGKGRITFNSTSTELDPKTNSIRFDRFAPISDVEKVMTKIEGIKGVQSTRDDSDENDPFKTAFVINFAKNLKGEPLAEAIKQVNLVLTSNYTFDVKVTDRFIRENGQAGASLRSTNIPKMLEDWLDYRIKIEVDACKFWTKEAENRIAYLELMRTAITNIDTIVKHIKNKKLDDQKLLTVLSKDLKITEDQANLILARNLRQLRHLEDQKLIDSIKELKHEIKGYAARIKNPKNYISDNLKDVVTKVTNSRKLGKKKLKK